MYNASRRKGLANAVEFLSLTPLAGVTLMENLWELNRLAIGDFITKPEGSGFLVHFPNNGDPGTGEMAERLYEHLHRGTDLPFSYIYFSGLGTAIQCSLFLLGNLSPIREFEDRVECTNYVFDHLFKEAFLPYVGGRDKAALKMFGDHTEVVEGFQKYCMPPYPKQLNFDRDILNWFIKLVNALETDVSKTSMSTSVQFKKFSEELLSGLNI